MATYNVATLPSTWFFFYQWHSSPGPILLFENRLQLSREVCPSQDHANSLSERAKTKSISTYLNWQSSWPCQHHSESWCRAGWLREDSVWSGGSCEIIVFSVNIHLERQGILSVSLCSPLPLIPSGNNPAPQNPLHLSWHYTGPAWRGVQKKPAFLVKMVWVCEVNPG